MPLYVCHRGTPDRVYRFPDDVADGGTPSGTDVTLWNLPTTISNPDAIVIYEGEIIVTDDTGNEVGFFAESTTGGTTPTLTRLIDLVSALTAPSGIAINSDGMWVGDDAGEEVFLLPTSNAGETTNADGTVIVDLADTDIIKRFDLHSDVTNIEGLTIVGNNLVIAQDFPNDRIWYSPLSTANGATATIVREIILPPAIGAPYGIAAGMDGNLFVVDVTNDDMYLIPSTKANETTGTDGRIIVTLLDSDIIRQHNLPTGLISPYGLAFKSNQATLTLSTDDTDIRAGEPVDIDIASDIGISNFVASDCTVTNGTRGALTINSVTSATLRVTAGSAGTLTVEIAEDAVDPGNVAASEDFTVNAADLSFGSETVDNQAWVVGTGATVTLPTATGGTGTIVYSLSPTLPAGKTFTAATRVLSGTPTGRFSSATFTYTATDGNDDTVELTFTIVVAATAITFDTSIANQSWVVGTAVNLTMPTVSGGVGAFTYSLTPTLPAGTTFTAGTRLVSGTPTTAVASATYTYRATDAEGISASRTFTIVVTAAAVALSFGSSAIANQSWVVGTAITSLTLPTATGGNGAITYSLSPTLPTGTTFVASTRVLSGNPTAVFTSNTFIIYC